MTELDERKAAVLRAIVEQYVDTAQPVGSQTVTSTTGLGVSAATVRNEMSLLEREGYIAQPHPSAGPGPDRPGLPLLRRPPRRRRSAPGDRAPPHRRVLQQRHAGDGPAPRRRRASCSRGVTAHAAVVVGPEPQAVVVRAANLVSLQPRVVLAVVVLSNGSVEKEVVVFDDDVSEDDVADASARFAQQLGGRRLADFADVPAEPRRRPAARADRPRRRDRRRGAASRCRPASRSTRASRSTSAARAGSRPSTTRSSPRAPRACSSCSSSTSCSRR